MSEFRNTRPDSPKGKVWAMYDKKGEKAARKLGETLDIAASKLNRWFKDEGKGFQAINDKTRAKKADDEAPKKKNGKAPAKKVAAKSKPTPAKKVAAKKKPAPRKRRETEGEEAAAAA